MSDVPFNNKPLPAAPGNTFTTHSGVEPPPLSHDLGLQAPPVRVPFRFKWVDLTAAGFPILPRQLDVSTWPSIAERSSFFSKAEFGSLRITIAPLSSLFNHAQTITTVWSHTDVILTPDNIFNLPGSSTRTFGGPMVVGQESVNDCICQSMMCTFKDVVTYRYLPRAIIQAGQASPSAGGTLLEPTTVTCSIFIEGELILSNPILTTW